MAYEESLTCVTVPANADLSSSQYLFVKGVNSNGEARLATTGNGERAIGVLQNDPSSAGDAGTLGVLGISKVVASGVITAGDDVASDAAGKATVAATGDYVLGVAMESAAVDGDIIPVLLLGSSNIVV